MEQTTPTPRPLTQAQVTVTTRAVSMEKEMVIRDGIPVFGATITPLMTPSDSAQ